jgi:hypothetical protein
MYERLCPHCGRPWPKEPQVTGKRRQAMVNALSRNPNGLTVYQLLDKIYADDADGGACRQVIPVMARSINKQLRSRGWRITATGGPGSRYRLEATESVLERGIRGRGWYGGLKEKAAP